MSRSRFEFVIYTPGFSDSSGGIIALHLLCQRLRQLGVSAAVWPEYKPAPRGMFKLPKLRSLASYYLKGNYKLFPDSPFNNPVAARGDLKNAIIVYPEIVEGNPLRGRGAVRWLLHRPGYHSGQTGYGPDDLFFFYQEAFNDPAFNSDPTNRLTVSWINQAYHDRGEMRAGTCYLLRKGKGREIVHDLSNSICVDGMTHEEASTVFNRTHRFYSYDLYTMYSMYSALCGCIPIVVPDPGLTKEEWTPEEYGRYGLAYGEEEIEWAVETRAKLLERLATERETEDRMVAEFVRKCRQRFG